jgi:hypothetical protein
MGVVGAVADDQEAEYIRNVCENDIVTSENLLAALRYVFAQYLVFQTASSLKVPLQIFCMNFPIPAIVKPPF